MPAPLAPQRPLRHLRHAEVGEPQPVALEQDEVVGLDVAVDDPLAVGVADGRQHLPGEVDGRVERQPAVQPLVERHQPPGRDDDEELVDELRVLERQDVGVLHPRDQPHFLAEVLHRRAR